MIFIKVWEESKARPVKIESFFSYKDAFVFLQEQDRETFKFSMV
jgi:hypothetical protein